MGEVKRPSLPVRILQGAAVVPVLVLLTALGAIGCAVEAVRDMLRIGRR